MSTSLDGKTALVTGAGRGLGRATALRLASAGETVALLARSAAELAETAARCMNSAGPRWWSVLTCPDPASASTCCGPGPVDTSPQAWIRGQDPGRIGTVPRDRFSRSYEAGTLITPEHSARSLLARLDSDATGQAQDVSDPP
jgi:NAD(P)-dependent dehydrogenase (short-subunit alcohol dehydrogenase family)